MPIPRTVQIDSWHAHMRYAPTTSFSGALCLELIIDGSPYCNTPHTDTYEYVWICINRYDMNNNHTGKSRYEDRSQNSHRSTIRSQYSHLASIYCSSSEYTPVSQSTLRPNYCGDAVLQESAVITLWQGLNGWDDPRNPRCCKSGRMLVTQGECHRHAAAATNSISIAFTVRRHTHDTMYMNDTAKHTREKCSPSDPMTRTTRAMRTIPYPIIPPYRIVHYPTIYTIPYHTMKKKDTWYELCTMFGCGPSECFSFSDVADHSLTPLEVQCSKKGRHRNSNSTVYQDYLSRRVLSSPESKCALGFEKATNVREL